MRPETYASFFDELASISQYMEKEAGLRDALKSGMKAVAKVPAKIDAVDTNVGIKLDGLIRKVSKDKLTAERVRKAVSLAHPNAIDPIR